jgi:CDP-glucose 4,6-dehydratase
MSAFWRGKRVFITGHTGFKGGWLTLWVEALGAKVAGYSLAAPTEPSFCEVVGVEVSISSTRNDIRDLSALRKCMAEFRPEIVLHLAAQALVRPSYEDPVGTYTTNIIGTVNVLECVRQCPTVRSVVIVTSDKCYENKERDQGYREDEAMGGYDPYSSSKGCAELVTASYRSSFFNEKDYSSHHVSVASGRAGNVIGGGDWAKDRLVPDMIRAIVAGQPVRIRNPNAVRPWQHVLEPLGGYLLLAERIFEEGPKLSGGWNFGPLDKDARKVQDIVVKLTQQWGDGARWEADQGNHPHEARFLKLDCSRAHALLGWRPRLDVDMALAWTVDWYKAWRNGKDMRALSLRQISTYSELQPTQ